MSQCLGKYSIIYHDVYFMGYACIIACANLNKDFNKNLYIVCSCSVPRLSDLQILIPDNLVNNSLTDAYVLQVPPRASTQIHIHTPFII